MRWNNAAMIRRRAESSKFQVSLEFNIFTLIWNRQYVGTQQQHQIQSFSHIRSCKRIAYLRMKYLLSTTLAGVKM